MLTPEQIERSIQPKSDQLNAIDFVAGPEVLTVERAEPGPDEKQPWNIHMAERPGRPYRPSKSMRRVIRTAWGAKAQEWIGRKVELYLDPDEVFGSEKVGGIKISAISHIDKPIVITLLRQRKRIPHTVKPLAQDATPVAPSISDAQIEDAATVDELRELWFHGTDPQKARIQQRVQELQDAADTDVASE